MDANLVNAELGIKIRELRNKNGLTQQELADRTELTKGYISQLERGQVAPSVVTLLDIIECLGSTPSDFFKTEEFKQITYSENEFFEKIDDEGNSIQWIVPPAQNNQMEPLLVEIEPKKALSPDKPHDGEEFGYVLQGTILLHLGDSDHTVSAGESFYYAADKDHSIENPEDEKAKFIWVSTPPSF